MKDAAAHDEHARDEHGREALEHESPHHADGDRRERRSQLSEHTEENEPSVVQKAPWI